MQDGDTLGSTRDAYPLFREDTADKPESLCPIERYRVAKRNTSARNKTMLATGVAAAAIFTTVRKIYA